MLVSGISCLKLCGGLDFTWCQSPDRGLPCPDGVFFLHIDEKARFEKSNGTTNGSRMGPEPSYKLRYNRYKPYKWPYKYVTGVSSPYL